MQIVALQCQYNFTVFPQLHVILYCSGVFLFDLLNDNYYTSSYVVPHSYVFLLQIYFRLQKEKSLFPSKADVN